MRRPDVAMVRRIARAAGGDGVELSALCDYVEALEAQAATLRAQLVEAAKPAEAAAVIHAVPREPGRQIQAVPR